MRLRERVRAEKAAKGLSSPSTVDMGIYVEDNGKEKLYALTPAAKEWARNRLKKVKKEASDEGLNQDYKPDKNEANMEKEGEVHESGFPNQQNQEHEETDQSVLSSDEVFNKLLENLSEEYENPEPDVSKETKKIKESSAVAKLEDTIDSEKSNNLGEMLNKVQKNSHLKKIELVNLEELDGLTKTKDLEESSSTTDLEDLDSLDSREIRNLENVYINQTSNPQEISKNVREFEGVELIKCGKFIGNLVDTKESLASKDTGRGESSEPQEVSKELKPMDKKYIFLQENCSQTSKSENDDDNCSQCSSSCPRRKEEDDLLFRSCHNFLRHHIPRSNGSQSSDPLTLCDEELLGEIWDTAEVEESPPSPEFDSEAEGQAHVRRLISDHNSQHQNESDIEEILENMEFEASNMQSVYQRHNLVAMSSLQETADDSDPEDRARNEDGMHDRSIARNINGFSYIERGRSAPMFGERWVEEARRRIIEEVEWLEEVESFSSTCEEDESLDDLSLESSEDSSLADEESSFFEEESVSSISPVVNKAGEIKSILKYETSAAKGLLSGYTADCDSSEPNHRSEESETTSCSSLSLTSLHDSSAAENTGITHPSSKLSDESEKEIYLPSTNSSTHPIGDTTVTASDMFRGPHLGIAYPGNVSQVQLFEQNTHNTIVSSSGSTSNPSDGLHTRLVPSRDPSKSTLAVNQDCLPVPIDVGVSGEAGDERPTGHTLKTLAEVGDVVDMETRGDVSPVMRDSEILGDVESKGNVTDVHPVIDHSMQADVGPRGSMVAVWPVTRDMKSQADVGTRGDTAVTRPVTRDSETLAGDSIPSKNQESIFSARDALRSSHEAFVRGHNIGENHCYIQLKVIYVISRSPLLYSGIRRLSIFNHSAGSLLITRDEENWVKVAPLLVQSSSHTSQVNKSYSLTSTTENI